MADADVRMVGLARSYPVTELTSALACFVQQASHFCLLLRSGGRQVVCYNSNGGPPLRMALPSVFACKTIGRGQALLLLAPRAIDYKKRATMLSLLGDKQSPPSR